MTGRGEVLGQQDVGLSQQRPLVWKSPRELKTSLPDSSINRSGNRNAAVDWQYLAGDHAGLVASEIQRGIGDVARLN